MIGFFIVILVFLGIFGGASFYIAYRVYQGMSAFFSGVRFWPVLTVFLLLAATMVLGFGRSMLPLSDGIKHILNVVGFCYMGIFIYLLIFTAAVDLISLLPRLMKLSFTAHHFFKGGLTVTVLVLTAITSIYGFCNARQIDSVSYEVELSKATDISDLNIVMISDLHLGSLGSEGRLEEIVERINAQKPDLICIAGDFFDTDFAAIRNPEKAKETLKTLRATYGTYVCLGNHDAGSTASQMTDFLRQCDIRLLAEEYTVIDNRLVLVGRLDGTPIGGYAGQSRKPLSQVLNDVDASLPVIVLDHNPGNISEYHQEVDLILCGHTHKGQLFPASLITGAMYTIDHGHYQKDAQSPHVIVTSGIGYWGMPMRVGTDSEIVTIRCT